MQSVYKKISCAASVDNEYMSFGKTVGLKLHKLTTGNKIAALHAQRIINDALFKAEMGRISDNTVLTDVSIL